MALFICKLYFIKYLNIVWPTNTVCWIEFTATKKFHLKYAVSSFICEKPYKLFKNKLYFKIKKKKIYSISISPAIIQVISKNLKSFNFIW